MRYERILRSLLLLLAMLPLRSLFRGLFAVGDGDDGGDGDDDEDMKWRVGPASAGDEPGRLGGCCRSTRGWSRAPQVARAHSHSTLHPPLTPLSSSFLFVVLGAF